MWIPWVARGCADLGVCRLLSRPLLLLQVLLAARGFTRRLPVPLHQGLANRAAQGPAGMRAHHVQAGAGLRPDFERRLLALTTVEELAFHDSDFVTPILLPPSGLRDWLVQRRTVLATVVGPAATMPDMHALTDLLGALYGQRGPTVARAIGGAVYLLTPVTVRAEAWLSARVSRPRWGGARQRRDSMPS